MNRELVQSAWAAAPRETRWPVALAIVVVLALLLLMPSRVRLLPPWGLVALGACMLAPVIAAALHPQDGVWARIERGVTLAFVAVAGWSELVILRELIIDIIRGDHAVSGLQLLASSISVWATNVLMFSLLYWQLDRGGPSRRAAREVRRPDWIFPQDQADPERVPAGWRPQFIDYLFLGYSTATAFSTTDAQPLTGRAKLAMMAESTVSLVTLVVVAARAINVLGS